MDQIYSETFGEIDIDRNILGGFSGATLKVQILLNVLGSKVKVMYIIYINISTKAPINYSIYHSLHLDHSSSPRHIIFYFDWSVIRTY